MGLRGELLGGCARMCVQASSPGAGGLLQVVGNLTEFMTQLLQPDRLAIQARPWNCQYVLPSLPHRPCLFARQGTYLSTTGQVPSRWEQWAT